MKVTAGVKKGIGKELCDDTAVVGDNILNEQMESFDVEAPCCIGLADGVGGNNGGKDASMFVANALIGLSNTNDLELESKMKRINENLVNYSKGIPGKEDMATTLSVLVFSYDKAYLVHVGNTRIYAKRGSFLKQITTDHTTYQWLLKTGQIEAAEACNRNEIISAFGGGNVNICKQIDIKELALDTLPSTIVISTDGVHDHVPQDDLEDIMTEEITDIQKIEKMISMAEEKGSVDDKSVIIIRL